MTAEVDGSGSRCGREAVIATVFEELVGRLENDGGSGWSPSFDGWRLSDAMYLCTDVRDE